MSGGISEDMVEMGWSASNTAARMLQGEDAGRELAWSIMVAVGAAVIALWWIYGALQTRVRRSTSGPVSWPVLGSLLEMRRNMHRLNDWFLGYFSVDAKTWSLQLPFPIRQKIISTVDPLVVEYILTNIHMYGKGTVFRARLGDFLGSGIFMSDGDTWRRHRKIASTEFSTRKLREHSNTVYREDAIRLVNTLNLAMAANKPVEFQNWALRMTLDSICKVAFGVDMGSLSPSLPDVPFAAAFDAVQSIIPKRIVNPLFRLQRALNVGSERRFSENAREVNSFAKSVIDKRRLEIAAALNAGQEFKGEDLLSKFMAYPEGDENHYSDGELRDVIVDFLLAGRDTTGITLAWFMYEICLHPEIADKIYEEGVEVVGKHTGFESMAEHLTHDNLGRLCYLHAALSESLRLHPAVPRLGKAALVDDVLPDGTVVKKGDIVQYVPYSMARMPFIWGSDALELKPERWLKDGVFQSVSSFKFTTFQAGPRICLGRDSAFLQLKVTLSLIIHFFTFQLVRGQELTYTSALVMPMKNGVQVTISPRQK